MSILCDPGAILKHYVASFWTSESGPTSAGLRRILPDGKPGLVIRYSEGGAGPRVFFGGQTTKFSSYQMQPNQKFIGVHFQSVGAAEFLGMPLGDLTDQSIDLRDWDSQWARELEERMNAAATLWERSLIMRELLERKLCAAQPNWAAKALVETIKKGDGSFLSKDLCQLANASERQIERIFHGAVGLTPRKLNSIFRFRRAMASIGIGLNKSLTDVALGAGYYDQSHFIRDFNKMVGLSPKAYLRGERALNDWQGLNL